MDFGRCWNRCCPTAPLSGSGRPRVDDRVAFTAILFVLRDRRTVAVGASASIGCSGVTAWRRLRDWQAAGVWDRLHRELLTAAQRRRASSTGRSGSSTAATSARFEADALTGPSPVDRARAGSKHHLIVDRHGVPLRRHADRRPSQRRHAAAPTPRRHRRHRRQAPAGLASAPTRSIADRGYDHDKYRRELWRRGVKPADRTARHRARLGTRTRALGGGGHVCSAAQLPPAPHPLGNATPPCTTCL